MVVSRVTTTVTETNVTNFGALQNAGLHYSNAKNTCGNCLRSLRIAPLQSS